MISHYLLEQWFPTFIKAHTPKISQYVLAPLKYFNMSRAGAILKARLKLRVLTFFWESASFWVELNAAHSFLAKVGTRSVRLRRVDGVDLKRKKGHHDFLNGFTANEKNKAVTFSFFGDPLHCQGAI